MTWVLQIRNRGWRDLAEGTYEEVQKAYVNELWTCGCYSTIELRIREKDRKPRKNCECRGTGLVERTTGRGETCETRCGCLDD
jgi:hypothetical protein